MGKKKSTVNMTTPDRFKHNETMISTALGQASKALKMSKELRKNQGIGELEIARLRSLVISFKTRVELAESELDALQSSIEFYSGIQGTPPNKDKSSTIIEDEDEDRDTYTPLPPKKEVVGYEFKDIKEA